MQIQIFINSLPVQGKAYQAGKDIILHIPALIRQVGEEPTLLPPFKDLFQPVSAGFIEVGEWDGKAYEFEGSVELALGPDGKVWAQVCKPDDIPKSGPLAGTITIPCPLCHGSGVAHHTDAASRKPYSGRCSLCWGSGDIPCLDRWTHENGTVFALGYWNCLCKHEYIHPNNHDACPVCGAAAEGQPSSRADEAQAYLVALGIPGESLGMGKAKP